MIKVKEYILRNASCITNNIELEHLYTFKDFPVFMGCTNDEEKNDLVADMSWYIDPLSGFIQLTKLIPLDILYMDQHMDATGATWSRYNKELSNFIIKYYDGNILEIGGGSGKLANLILGLSTKVEKYLVVEPNPMFEESEKLKVIKTFFTENLKINNDDGVKTVVLSQVLEHVYDPRDFLRQVYNFLPIKGRFIFGYPNLEHLFSNKYTNAINFEHSFLMTDFFVDSLLIETGFKIVSKIEYENHSHFYCVEKVEEGIKANNLQNKYGHYKNMFNEFIQYHNNLVAELNNKINELESPIFLFGAHIFSQYLFSFGLNKNKIIKILDNSPIKQGKRLYGTSLEVVSPNILSNYKKPIVILKAGLYNQEIMDDILKNINNEVVFI
jgi:SAM-dependent methyltransferase